MLSIAYVSSATRELTETELVGLMAQVRAKNTALGVSGMLLYSGGNFMQVIEGPEETLRELYATITDDPRHRGVITVLEESIDERRFEEWTMGFRRLTTRELEEVSGWTDFMQAADARGDTGESVHHLLASFRDSMR